jgi:chemotaxis protein MotA
MMALPISDKLKLRAAEEALNKNLILDAILGIQDRQNPRAIESALRNYLPVSKRQIDTADEESK